LGDDDVTDGVVEGVVGTSSGVVTTGAVELGEGRPA
jgi:hypothetical protein